MKPASHHSGSELEGTRRIRLAPIIDAEFDASAAYSPVTSAVAVSRRVLAAETRSIEIDWSEQIATTKVVDAPRVGNHLKFRALCGAMEVPMTMHGDHHLTDTEDAAFDSTMKWAGIGVVLLAIIAVAGWYFSG